MKTLQANIIKALFVVALIAVIFTCGTFGRYLFSLICVCILVRLVASGLSATVALRRRRRTPSREFTVKMVARIMGIFFISGTLLFFVALLTAQGAAPPSDPIAINNTELIARSLVSSLDLFMLDIDSNILDKINNAPLIKGAISVQALLSFGCTVALLISLVFSRVRAYYRLHRLTRITDTRNHLYIFFSHNTPARLLALDVRRNDPDAIIIFVDPANVNDSSNSSWDNIVSLFTHRQLTFDHAGESDALVAIASHPLHKLPKNDIDTTRGNPDIFEADGLSKIRDLITELAHHPKGARLNIFFMSDSEEENIADLLVLSRDTTLLDNARFAHIYCHARSNNSNKILEDLAIRKSLDVTIVDSSRLSVEGIKRDPACQPVRVATLDPLNPTTVTRPIDSLIIGFGEVGRDIFRFIYEFGTLLDSRSTPEYCIPATPRITAIDRNMDLLKGRFINQCPGIDFTDPSLSLLNLDFTQSDFYRTLLTPERSRSLNYIVVATADDQTNLDIAIDLFNHIRRHRVDLSHLIIMVRCSDDQHAEIARRIADHYNNGYDSHDDAHPVIRLFGFPSDIYTFDNIIGERMLNHGKTFLKCYLQGADHDTPVDGDPWNERRAKLTAGSNIDKLRQLRRKEQQDLANALHVATKSYLLHSVLGHDDSRFEQFCQRLFDDRSTNLDHIILTNLSILEHLRWNASHLLLGYTPSDSHTVDERTLSHNCLRPWHELDAESAVAGYEYKSFDLQVVLTSIYLSHKHFLQ